MRSGHILGLVSCTQTFTDEYLLTSVQLRKQCSLASFEQSSHRRVDPAHATFFQLLCIESKWCIDEASKVWKSSSGYQE